MRGGEPVIHDLRFARLPLCEGSQTAVLVAPAGQLGDENAFVIEGDVMISGEAGSRGEGTAIEEGAMGAVAHAHAEFFAATQVAVGDIDAIGAAGSIIAGV